MDADFRRAQPWLGTFVEVTATASPDIEKAIAAAFAAVAQVHRLMSFHAPDSDVSRLNRDAGARAVTVHPWTFQVLKTAVELHRHARGMFDIAVAAAPQKIALLAGDCVRFLHPGIRIDLGGIAKGFAVDRAIEALRRRGVSRGLVNAGGDLAAFGTRPHTVCIRDPRDPARLIGQVALRNAALASSGCGFDLFRSADVGSTAVIDPATQESVRGIAGATVRAPSCMLADALTKVVMVAGEAAAPVLNHYRASALLVFVNRDVRVTANWQDDLAA